MVAFIKGKNKDHHECFYDFSFLSSPHFLKPDKLSSQNSEGETKSKVLSMEKFQTKTSLSFGVIVGK